MRFHRILATMICLWMLAIALTIAYRNPVWLLLPLLATLTNEILHRLTGCEWLFPSSNRTEIFYDMSIVPTRADTDQNYSEGYYPDDNYDGFTPREAENNKFAKILELLGAKEGDTILDMGCGVCPFELYCKERNIHMIGFTISSEQVKYCTERGVTSVLWDFGTFNEDFRGKVDHIVMLGSMEHLYTGAINFEDSYKKKAERMAEILEMSRAYFKPDGKPHRIFYSGLHINPATIHDWGWQVVERTHGGTLQCNSPDLDMKASATMAGMQTIYQRDATKDYYMATVLDRNHFGNPGNVYAKGSQMLLATSLVYPMAFYQWMYYVYGYWMWMFDGRAHTYGSSFGLECEAKRPATLWWFVFET